MVRFLSLYAFVYCKRMLVTVRIDPNLIGLVRSNIVVWKGALDYNVQLVPLSVDDRPYR